MDRQPVARFVFPARHSRAEEYACRVESALPPDLQRIEVRVGIVEALTNAIVHGAFRLERTDDDIEIYLDAIERAEQELAETAIIGVTVCAGDGRAEVIVDDFGGGFDWEHALAARGRGLGILREIFEAVSFSPGGSRVRLTIAGEGVKKNGRASEHGEVITAGADRR